MTEVLLESAKWDTKNKRGKRGNNKRDEGRGEDKRKEANWFSRASLIHAHPCTCSSKHGNHSLCICIFWWKRQILFSETVSVWEFFKFSFTQQILSFKTQIWSFRFLLKISPWLFMVYWKTLNPHHVSKVIVIYSHYPSRLLSHYTRTFAPSCLMSCFSDAPCFQHSLPYLLLSPLPGISRKASSPPIDVGQNTTQMLSPPPPSPVLLVQHTPVSIILFSRAFSHLYPCLSPSLSTISPGKSDSQTLCGEKTRFVCLFRLCQFPTLADWWFYKIRNIFKDTKTQNTSLSFFIVRLKFLKKFLNPFSQFLYFSLSLINNSFRAILGRVMPSSLCEKLCTWIPCMESFGNFPPVLFQMSGGTQRGVSL